MKILKVNDLLIIGTINNKIADTIIFNKYGLKTFTNSKLICKGLELTTGELYTLGFRGNDLMKEFQSLIESQGYYWGKNPIPVPEYQLDNFGNGGMDDSWIESYQEAESKTFNLDQTLIFKIL